MKTNKKATLFACLGAVGVLATVILAVKETPKAIAVLEEEAEIKGEDLTVKEKIFLTVPIYWPSITVGVGTVICIFGSNYLNKQSQASLASSYSMLTRTFDGYRDEIRARYGEEEEKDIYTKLIVEEVKSRATSIPWLGAGVPMLTDGVDESEGPITLYFDMMSERFYRTTPAHQFEAELRLNHNYAVFGQQSKNDYYDFLGIDIVDGGNDIGWSAWNQDEQAFILMNHEKGTTDDGLEFVIVDPVWPPEYTM